MKLQNIIYTNHMVDSVAFYEKLGLFREVDGEVNAWWNEFPVGDAILALHWNQDEPLPTQSNPELHFKLDTAAFEALHTALSDHNPDEMKTLEGIGRTFSVLDPNDVRVHINEIR